MEVHRLVPGEHGPEGSDRVTINRLDSGKTGFTGIRMRGNVTHHEVSPNSFESDDDAEAAALIWAEENGVETIYVERDNA